MWIVLEKGTYSPHQFTMMTRSPISMWPCVSGPRNRTFRQRSVGFGVAFVGKPSGAREFTASKKGGAWLDQNREIGIAKYFKSFDAFHLKRPNDEKRITPRLDQLETRGATLRIFRFRSAHTDFVA